ncbi:zinc-dependent metalloprotease [Canibacter oris]|uniref:Putative hydrolase n=1 Tax=Canibacter oris TaxID=1365628 RepID=A0A840DNF7_9MICO|nr:zinc-dependent metalloprotease [Canibacter oris]MBB4070746.1 putative hydrolase [Canibacter oris]
MSDKNQQPDGFDPAELAKMLQQMFGGSMDPSDLAKAAGLPTNPATLFGIFQNLSNAAHNSVDTSQVIDPAATRKAALAALQHYPAPAKEAAAATADAINTSLTLATAWLDRSTAMSAAADSPKFLDRTKWITGSIDTWISFASPVAESICTALNNALEEQFPPEVQALISGQSGLFRRLGSAMFAMQLGNAIAKLAATVFSGGDIGVPVLQLPGHAGGSFMPGNISDFVADFETDKAELVLYLTIRELANARLFKHAKWLRPHLETAISDYARGIEINTSQLDTVVSEVDPANPEAITELLQSGALIPPKTELQEQAHEDISHLLALIVGWVNVVTAAAAKDMPQAGALAELMRRRSATGGPAEKVFGSLIGLELQPRKLREAQQLWQRITELGGAQLRDSLWQHPDLLPTIAELETPARLFERLGFADTNPEADTDYDFDADLAKLLSGGYDGPADTANPTEPDDAAGPKNPNDPSDPS